MDNYLQKPKGLYTCLVTPFDEKNVLDERGLRRNLQMQKKAQVNAVVLFGTTGESFSLSQKEKDRIVVIALEECYQDIPVIVDIEPIGKRQTIKLLQHYQRMQVSAAVVPVPYGKTQEEIFSYFSSITQAVNLPIIVANTAENQPVNLLINTLLKISSLPQVIAIKECPHSHIALSDLPFHTTLPVLGYEDSWAYTCLFAGAVGIFSIAANIFFEEMLLLLDFAYQNNALGAKKIYDRLVPFFKALGIAKNPIAIKAAMQHLSFPAGGCRPPLNQEVSLEQQLFLARQLEKMQDCLSLQE